MSAAPGSGGVSANQLCIVLQQQLSPVPSTNQAARQQLLTFGRQHPADCLALYCQIAQQASSVPAGGRPTQQQQQLLSVAQLAMLNFRQEVGRADQQSLWWGVTDPAARDTIRTTLFTAMCNMQHRAITRSIATCVFEVAGREMAEGEWPALWEWMLKATGAATDVPPLQREMALYLMEELCWTLIISMQPLLPTVVAHLQHNMEQPFPTEVRVAAIRAASNLMVCIEQESSELASLITHFEPLGGSYLVALNAFMQAGDTKGVRETLAFLLDTVSLQPLWFAPVAPSFVPVLLQLAGQTAAMSNIRELAFEVVVAWAEAAPALARKYGANDRVFLQKALPTLFQLLMEVPQEGTDTWGARQESVEQDPYCTARTAGTFMGRLAEAMGGERTLAVAFPIATGLVKSDNWQHQYAALHGLTNIIESVEGLDAAAMVRLTDDAVTGLRAAVPQVRYAALSVIGQLAYFHGPAYQEVTHATMLPLLAAMLKDAVPRVITHTASCFMNYVQYCQEEMLVPHLDGMLTSMKAHLAYPGATAREETMSSMACLVEMCRTSAPAYAPALMPDILAMAAASPSALQAVANVGDMRGTRARAYDCIAAFVGCMSVEQFVADADTIIGVFQKALAAPRESDDPLCNHLWASLNAITGHMGGGVMGKYMDIFIPHLLRSCVVEGIAVQLSAEEEKAQRRAEPDEEGEAGEYIFENEEGRLVRVRSTGFEELTACIKCLATLTRNAPGAFKASVGQFLEKLLPVLGVSSIIFSEPKTHSLHCVTGLMAAAVSDGATTAAGAGAGVTGAAVLSTVLPHIMSQLGEEVDPEMADSLVACLRQCVEVASMVPDGVAEKVLRGITPASPASPLASPPGSAAKPPRQYASGGTVMYDASPAPGVVYGPFFTPLLSGEDCTTVASAVAAAHAASIQRSVVITQGMKVNAEMLDEEEAEKQYFALTKEEELQTGCFSLYGTLLKTHRDAFLPILTARVLPGMAQFLGEGVSAGTKRQAVFLVDDLLENHPNPGAVWREYGAVLTASSTSDVSSLRHCAVYGVGAAAAFVPQMDAGTAQTLVQALVAALEQEQARAQAVGDAFEGSQVTDNIISALVKMGVYQLGTGELASLQGQVASTLVQLLPLMKFDKDEILMVVSLLADRVGAGDSGMMGGEAWPHFPAFLAFMVQSQTVAATVSDLTQHRLASLLARVQAAKPAQLQAAVAAMPAHLVEAVRSLLGAAASPTAASPGRVPASPPGTPGI